MYAKSKTSIYRALNKVILFVFLFASFGESGVPAVFGRTLSAETLNEATSEATHYIVFEKRADGTITPQYYKLVEVGTPLTSLSDTQMLEALAHPSRNTEQIAVTLHTSNDQIVYQNVIQVSSWLRGEFKGITPGAPIEGHIIPQEIISFVVRVPQIEGTTIILENDRFERIAQFDIQQLATKTPPIKLDSSMEVSVLSSITGPVDNRVDLLIMGDGYTNVQLAKFNSDASAVASQFFSISPYSEYINYYNIHTLFTGSSQSGADHPPYNPSCGIDNPNCCSDPAMQFDPLQGTMVNTAFDSRFCYNGIHRLLVPNYSKVWAAAAAVPYWDTILLIVNDPIYGGSGGSDIAVISLEASAALIAQHEYGHSFVGLADEYELSSSYPPCSDKSGSAPCESNVTDVTNLAQLKWQPWINPGTQIPTPNDPFYDGIVGLFEGARYTSTGMYRSGYNCIMRSLGSPYCQVPSQAYVLRLYNGDWDMPGISLFEPGSTSPTNPTFNLSHPATQVFHAAILSPAGGPSTQITWLENGIPIAGANSDTYTYTTSIDALGLKSITLRAKDVTPLVHPAMAGNALQDEYTWTVNVTLFLDTPTNYWAWDWIKRLYSAGITGGCATNPLQYCPEASVTRAQMAVFLEKGWHYPSAFAPLNTPPTFSDTVGHWAEDWIEALRSDGITGGCGPNLYCPEDAVTRAQMSVFLLKSKYGSGYTPPAVGSSTGFNDVPITHWAAAWIKQLAAEGITGGCGTGIYCPDSPVTRAQMSVFLVRTFNLP